MKLKLQKWLCFSKNLTLATRLIAFVGIAISVLLITVLLNDLSTKDFEISRNVALALGLDWRHIYHKASVSKSSDPEGKIIFAIIIFYTVMFFTTNVILFLGAIWEKNMYAIPWLITEFLGCLSKLAALIFHVVTEIDDLSHLFLIGSTLYILVMIWWWLVVFSAQKIWQETKNKNSRSSFSTINETGIEFNSILVYSPEPYRSNHLYTTI